MAQFTIIKPNTNIHFIEHHKPVFYGLIGLALIAIILSYVIKPNWGTSFEGGTSITMHFSGQVKTDEVRRVFVDDPNFDKVSVQSFGAENESRYIVRTSTSTILTCKKMDEIKASVLSALDQKTSNQMTVGQWPSCNSDIEAGIRGDFFVSIVPHEGKAAIDPPLSAETVGEIMNAAGLDSVVIYDEVARRYLVKPAGIQAEVVKMLKDHFKERFDEATGVDEIVTVGADVGDKFRNDAIVSILLALGLMLLYIGIRFDVRYAPAAVVSLAVSTLVTWGIVVALKIEITLETVAAFLSLVGYGVNDTIVNFDRVRENIGLSEPGVTLAQIVNRSLNECLSRTVVTSSTTIMAVIPLAILSSGATADFAIIMSAGICVTTLGSIYVSCPLLLYLDAWMKKNQARAEERKQLEGSAA